MPLAHGKSKKAFVHNIKAEMAAGKPMKQSLAIAYDMKRRKKMAQGGDTVVGGTYESGAEKGIHTRHDPENAISVSTAGREAKSGTKWDRSAKSGLASSPRIDRSLAKEHLGAAKKEHKRVLGEMKSMKKPNLYAMGGETESGYLPMPEEHAEHVDMLGQDLVDRIMRKRYSEGGRVANDTPITAGFDPNQFDDLVLRDGLESDYGKDDNAGDALGDAQEAEDRADIVARIMRSRAKKDRMPRPA